MSNLDPSALVDRVAWLTLTALEAGKVGSVKEGCTGGSFLALAGSEFCPGAAAVAVALAVAVAVAVASLRGRPLLRFGESGGLPSTLSGVGRGGDVCSRLGSGALGGVLGGLPLFRLTGAAAFTLVSVELSLPG